MKFYCCGLVYSTDDPDTYWCIDTYNMKQPSIDIIGGKKIAKEIIYTLMCKKNGCFKVDVYRYYDDFGVLKVLETRHLKGKDARKFMESTKDMRIRQPQCCPIKKVRYSKNIPWVYGKTVDNNTQVVRYMDESGNRNVFKNQKWHTEVIKSNINTYTFNSLI